MHASPRTAPQRADLSACESEPIATPDAIQPFGALFAVDDETGRILAISANSGEIVGRESSALLNGRIESLFGPGSFHRLRGMVRGESDLSESYVERVTVDGTERDFDLFAHRSDGVLLVEVEPAQSQSASEVEAFFGRVRTAVARLQAAGTVAEVADILSSTSRELSGYDRVMVYRFDCDWNGEVIAERCDEQMTPYLGLRYPASDIPRQARQLYLRNMLRLIPDATYEPVPLLPTTNPLSGKPFDLSLSVLRSVSPVHLEYLANMGVAATLTASLMKHGQLWGLVAAHHRTPFHPAFRIRVACELLARTAALQITTLEDAAENAYRLRLQTLQPALLDAVDRRGEFTEAITNDQLLDMVNATGAAVKTEGEPVLVGRTPRLREVRAILNWLRDRDGSDGDRPFASDCLPLDNPDFAAIKETACGLLAVPLTTTKGGWILWFRPELVRSISWGGQPNKPFEADGMRISPRKSFEAWKEIVSLHSMPWESAQIAAAVELRRLVSDVMMRRAREYAHINAQLARSNQELESFAHVASHDLKEPLRGISHYTQFLMQDHAAQLDEQAQQMLHSIGALSNRMERQLQSLLDLARVGGDEEMARRCDANAALQEALDVLAQRLDAVEVRTQPLPPVHIAHARLREIFINLIGNGVKYNEKDEKRIEVGFLPNRVGLKDEEQGAQMVTLFVRDNGIGIREKHYESIFRMFKRLHGRDAYGGGTGAGLAIARKIVEQQGGQMWVESVPGDGSTFYFSIPEVQE